VSAQSRTVFDRLYAKAEKAEDLPWHRADPPALLVKALDARDRPGSALDVGCGAGTYSLYMARRGYTVTAVDFMPTAISMLQRQVETSGLDVVALKADITRWEAPRTFDVVLDVGCLHSLGSDRHAAYRERLLRWLAPGGDFILMHCGRRGWWDRWPIGPNRATADALMRLFGPELTLHRYEPEILTNMPLFMGRNALVGRYWFRRVT
jgi:SAM-dependent methyltransferase